MSILNDYRKNRAALINETLLAAGDPSGERWSAARAAEAINDAVLDFALRTEMVKDEINVQILAKVHDYNIKNRIETDGTKKDFGFPVRVGYSGTSEPAMVPTSRATLDLIGFRDEPWNVYAFREWYIDVLSPGRIAIVMPNADGEALPSEENNMQVIYVAMPDYMDDDADYPDSDIMPHLYEAFKFGAASRLLDESEDEGELYRAAEFDSIFDEFCKRATMEVYRGETPYSDARPG